MRSITRAVIMAMLINLAVVAAPLISLDIPHPLTHAPGDFRARLTIEPLATNRMACLYVQPLSVGDELTRCWSLNGDKEPKTQWQNLSHLSAGKYEVTAAVIDNLEHKTFSISVRLTVVGIGDDPEASLP